MLYKWGLAVLFILPGLDLNSDSFTEELINCIGFRNRKTAQRSFSVVLFLSDPDFLGQTRFQTGRIRQLAKKELIIDIKINKID